MENDYLVQKKPLNALLIFALPIIIGNLFQQTYTMADSAIVGQYVSEQALAAVGASYSLTNIFICVAIGGGIGASVIVSRYFGAKNYTKMKLAVYTAFISFLIISFLLGGFGLIFSKGIMVLLNTPSDVLDMAVEYLKNGKKVEDIPAQVVGIDYCSVNKDTMKALGLTKKDIKTKYEVKELDTAK